MSSILVCINPTESHVGPVLTAAKAFIEKGWRVRVLTGARSPDRVEAIGATPLALPPDGDVLDSLDLSGNRRGVKAMNDGLYRAFVEPTPPQFRAQYRDASARIGTDIAASPGAAGFADAVHQLVAGRATQTPARR
jgi:UDP:flavonoid glycosyltransferase YjiC (YdhE family)